eukprot:GHVN01014776.1.p1 GENE.GHVN01014776.1~~GHVN01014776.1.p1  ORF type:complete len:379 (-),score=89.71 GHVN01014776.1:186-1184(-)
MGAQAQSKTQVKAALAEVSNLGEALLSAQTNLKKQLGEAQPAVSGALIKAHQQNQSLGLVVEEAIEAHTQAVDKVREAADNLTNSLTNVQRAWETYHKLISTDCDDEGTERRAFLKSLERCATCLQQAFNEASDGLMFFTKLQHVLGGLNQQVKDWTCARSYAHDEALAALGAPPRYPPSQQQQRLRDFSQPQSQPNSGMSHSLYQPPTNQHHQVHDIPSSSNYPGYGQTYFSQPHLTGSLNPHPGSLNPHPGSVNHNHYQPPGTYHNPHQQFGPMGSIPPSMNIGMTHNQHAHPHHQAVNTPVSQSNPSSGQPAGSSGGARMGSMPPPSYI